MTRAFFGAPLAFLGQERPPKKRPRFEQARWGALGLFDHPMFVANRWLCVVLNMVNEIARLMFRVPAIRLGPLVCRSFSARPGSNVKELAR